MTSAEMGACAAPIGPTPTVGHAYSAAAPLDELRNHVEEPTFTLLETRESRLRHDLSTLGSLSAPLPVTDQASYATAASTADALYLSTRTVSSLLEQPTVMHNYTAPSDVSPYSFMTAAAAACPWWFPGGVPAANPIDGAAVAAANPVSTAVNTNMAGSLTDSLAASMNGGLYSSSPTSLLLDTRSFPLAPSPSAASTAAANNNNSVPPLQLAQLGMAGSVSPTSYSSYLTTPFNSILSNTITPHIPLLSATHRLSASTMSNGGGKATKARYSSSRASTARACECPECQKRRLGGSDERVEKHSCHVPGCQKVYAKSSHLKAHLRWHSNTRPSRQAAVNASARS